MPIVSKCGNLKLLGLSGPLLIILLSLLLCPDTLRLSNINSELQKWKTSYPYRHFCAFHCEECSLENRGILFLCISILLCDFLFFILHYVLQMHNCHKLSHFYMFRHYRIILRELVINALPSCTSISNAAVGNTV